MEKSKVDMAASRWLGVVILHGVGGGDGVVREGSTEDLT